jgi:S-adenosylmethionine/arginine decarboxylase-like enzyme
MTNFGTLMIFDCVGCNAFINDKAYLDEFVNSTVKEMGMKKINNPAVEWFPDNDFNRKHDLIGFSYLQIISLSSITIHCCTLSGKMYIDVFTCCKINDTLVDAISFIIQKLFSPLIINKKQINR